MIQTAIPRAAGRGYHLPTVTLNVALDLYYYIHHPAQYNDFLTSNMLIASAFQQKKFAEFSKADPHPHGPRLYRYLQFIQLASQTPERMQFSSYLQRQTCSEFACWVFYNSTIVQYFNSNIGIVPPPINIQQ